jgi:hypothetical protein
MNRGLSKPACPYPAQLTTSGGRRVSGVEDAQTMPRGGNGEPLYS